MYAVIFEVEINENRQEEYLAIAAKLKEQLVTMDGFISIERFTSLVNEGKLLSLSFWETEKAIIAWKKNIDHMSAQSKGRESIFKDYRIRIANVERDYTMETSTLTKK
jgi:heme-degrading monooxygenase HmoA